MKYTGKFGNKQNIVLISSPKQMKSIPLWIVKNLSQHLFFFSFCIKSGTPLYRKPSTEMKVTNSMSYGIRRFNAALTRALQ